MELYFTLSPVELPKEINTVRNTFHIPVELYSMLSPPVFSNRDNYRKLKIHSISLWKCIFTLPSGAFNNWYLQSKIHSKPLWNCILHSPSGVFKRDKYSLRYIPHPFGSVQIWLSPQRSFQQDIMRACNTFCILVELYFTLSPVDLSIRDNFSLKYIPYPCGTVSDSLPSRVFSKV